MHNHVVSKPSFSYYAIIAIGYALITWSDTNDI